MNVFFLKCVCVCVHKCVYEFILGTKQSQIHTLLKSPTAVVNTHDSAEDPEGLVVNI